MTLVANNFFTYVYRDNNLSLKFGILIFTEVPENEEDVEDSDGGGGEYTSEAHKFCREGANCFVFALVADSNARSGGAGSGNPSSISSDG